MNSTSSGIGGYPGEGVVLGASASAQLTGGFYRNLAMGSSGADVLALQRFLNTMGYPVAVSGAGSPGNETQFYGALTARAVAKWQAGMSIFPASGNLDTTSRNYINTVLSDATGGSAY